MERENEVTKRIAKLEDENRRLSAALKNHTDSECIRVEVDLSPVFDSRGELANLSNILGAILHLMGLPGEGDTERDNLQALFLDIQETVANCAEALGCAIEGMKIVTPGSVKSAPTAEAAAAGA